MTENEIDKRILKAQEENEETETMLKIIRKLCFGTGAFYAVISFKYMLEAPQVSSFNSNKLSFIYYLFTIITLIASLLTFKPGRVRAYIFLSAAILMHIMQIIVADPSILLICAFIPVSVLYFFMSKYSDMIKFINEHPEYSDNDTIIPVPRMDPEMETAINKARENIPTFINALKNPQENDKKFSVKIGIAIPGNVNGSKEYIWLESISIISENKFSGTLVSEPFFIEHLHKGQVVEFDALEISDWMFHRGENIHGGTTVKLLFEKNEKSERSPEEIKLYNSLVD